MNRAIETYRYHEAAQVLWQFFWHEFCDWYVELKKLRFQEGSGLTAGWRNTAGGVRDRAAPAASGHAVPHRRAVAAARRRPAHAARHSIALAAYPQYRPELADHEAEREIAILQEIVTMARTLRTEAKLDPKQQLHGTVYSRNGGARNRPSATPRPSRSWPT